MHVEKVVDGDWAMFILWAPDFGPSSSTIGSTAFEQDTFLKINRGKQGNANPEIKSGIVG